MDHAPTNKPPLPRLFYCDLTGAPFDHCISCECELIESRTPYMIEKAIKPYNGLKNYATIFEYAMCMSCMMSYQSVISAHSMANIKKYFTTHVDFAYRAELNRLEVFDNLDLWMERCLIKGSPVTSMYECQLYAQCEGDRLVMGEFPYTISGEVLDELIDILSPETKDAFDKLQQDLIGPSEFQDLLKGGPRVFI